MTCTHCGDTGVKSVALITNPHYAKPHVLNDGQKPLVTCAFPVMVPCPECGGEIVLTNQENLLA
jgi:hypothetical protein